MVGNVSSGDFCFFNPWCCQACSGTCSTVNPSKMCRTAHVVLHVHMNVILTVCHFSHVNNHSGLCEDYTLSIVFNQIPMTFLNRK